MSTIKGVGLVQAKIKEGCNLQIIHARAWNEPTCSQFIDLCVYCFILTYNFCVMAHWINTYLGITSQCLSLISE